MTPYGCYGSVMRSSECRQKEKLNYAVFFILAIVFKVVSFDTQFLLTATIDGDRYFIINLIIFYYFIKVLMLLKAQESGCSGAIS